MKILKSPKNPKATKRTCFGCKAILLVDEKDWKFQSDQREGDYWYVNCPLCKTLIYKP